MVKTESMIDRVAKAICRWDGEDWNGPLGSRDCSRNRYRAMARAAIKAMRKPNYYMMENGDSAISDAKGFGTAQGWRAMIDAALFEEKT